MSDSGFPQSLWPELTQRMILGHGYLGLARWRAGDDTGRARLREAIAAFEAQVERGLKVADESAAAAARELAADARFGVDQLRVVETKYASPGTAR